MSRKSRRRRRHKNPIRRIFSLVRKFFRRLQNPSHAPQKKRKRNKRNRHRNPILLVMPFVSQFGEKIKPAAIARSKITRSQSESSSGSKTESEKKSNPKSKPIAKLEVASRDGKSKITRIQK